MAIGHDSRADRISGRGPGTDQRNAFERDRDRILYSPAFRRLGGVTQVVSADEGHTFHNRLTHSLKVAQIGRRLTEFVIRNQSDVARVHSINADVVETACLAHDLGHPPFGHVAEAELNTLIQKANATLGGYEGNAQSFRVVTRLSPIDKGLMGLDLTRASLNAILKYPWHHDGSSLKKWGAYSSENEEFEFARDGANGKIACAEAQLMSWADDISYAVHDTEDFFRGGLIPLDRISLEESGEKQRVVEAYMKRTSASQTSASDLAKKFNRVAAMFPAEPYNGRREDRFRLNTLCSALIGGYVKATRLLEQPDAQGRLIEVDEQFRIEIDLLKELTWFYVIMRPSLAAQQHGQRRIIKRLFRSFLNALHPNSRTWHLLPPFFQSEIENCANHFGTTSIPLEIQTRLVADTIASMTDIEAHKTYLRLAGVSPGSVLDPIVK